MAMLRNFTLLFSVNKDSSSSSAIINKGIGIIKRSYCFGGKDASNYRYYSYYYNGGNGGMQRRQELAKYALFGGGAALVATAVSGLYANKEGAIGATNSYVRNRLMKTYAYTVAGLGISVASFVALKNTGHLYRIAAMNPWMFFGVSLVSTTASLVLVQSIRYENTLSKHLAMGLFNACIGASFAPLAFIASPIFIQAGAATALMMGSLSFVAAMSPPETFLTWRGPLTVGLGVVIASSFGTIFFPASSMLMNVSLYGGLAVFGGFTLYDTQAVYQHALKSPYGHYDPINQSIGIYLDAINIFTRMVQIMLMQNSTRKR